MKCFDTAVIGGGVLGCFAARNLRRWNISTVLVEAAEDVCTGISKANTAIVYAGYDNKVGSLKAQMTVRGNGEFDKLCQELDVPFSRCGSLMVSFGCTGGQHRSVYCAESFARHIAQKYPGVRVRLIHREQHIEEIL